MNSETVIVNSLDPKCSVLESEGYVVVAESWGAHLVFQETSDLAVYQLKIDSLKIRGFNLIELTQDSADQVLELELKTNADYPHTPATVHELPTKESTLALWKAGTWIFGAFRESELVGVLAATQKKEEVNLDFGSVRSDQRGLGIGSGLASRAIVSLHKKGIRNFSTGGAASNAASLATVASLGFHVDEIWRSYSRGEHH
jgi:ribosomal protein S18 acetylase RimI-like enzyme